MPAKLKKKSKKQHLKFVIDCAHPVDDSIMDVALFDQFLHENIKVKGKKGNLGSDIRITREKEKIHVISEIPLKKSYLKYLTKKFLKKHNLRDWLRVVATDKTTYELRYFQINNEDEEDNEEEK